MITKRFELYAVAVLLLVGIVASCGGGGGGGLPIGGGGDSITVNIASQTTATTTTTYTGNLTTTPVLFGEVTTDQTVVELSGPTLQIALCAGGIGTGSYPIASCTSGGSVVDYYVTNNSTTTYYIASEAYSNTSGTVTLTSVGARNHSITGSFDAIVTNMTDTTDTKRIWGTFNVTNDM